MRIRAERWYVERHASHGDAVLLDVRGCDRGNGGCRARFLLPFERVEPLPSVRTPRMVGPARWRRHARQLIAAATPDPRALRAAGDAAAAILPFQLEPALAVTHGLGCRLLLADEVGLGKTVQAGLVLAELHRRDPDIRALVAVPAGLREQWHDELARRFGLPSAVLDAAALARSSLDAPPGANPWATHTVIVTSIDYVKRPEVMRALEALLWDAVVFDEAHALASRSDRAAAAALLAVRARTVVLLSATPHGGDDAAFARLCGLGAAGDAPLLLFRRTRHDAGLTVRRRTVWLPVQPTAPERAMHDALLVYARRVWQEADPATGARLAMSVLARRAASSAASLARSVERRLAALATGDDAHLQQLALPLGGDEATDDEPAAALRGRGLGDAAAEHEALQRILVLARRAADAESKVGALARLLRRTSEPVIVFTEYRDTLARLAAVFSAEEPAQLHGGLTRGERTAVLRRFGAGEVRLLLATDAASEGLNLHQHCRSIVHLELPWTPVRLEQRIGRVERIGQRQRVHALHLVAAGTAEETVVAHLLRRMAHIRRTLDRLAAVDPDGIPRSVLGGAALPEVVARAASTSAPRGVLMPRLRELAEREAERLEQVRRLGADVAGRPPRAAGGRTVESGPPALPARSGTDEARPLVAIVRRRGADPTCACYWVFRHDVTDAGGDLVWQHLVALHATAERVARGSLPAALLHPGAAVSARLAAERQALVERTRTAMSAPLRLAIEREHALMAAVAARDARLSALLLQPGLFDRRAEQAASAQAALRDEVLATCAARIRRLEAARRLVSGGCLLGFAVAVGG